MAKTLREVIAELSKMTEYMDKPVAYTILSSDDVELVIDQIDTEDSKDKIWETIVDEVQGDLDEGFISQQITESIYDEITQTYKFIN